MKYNTCNFSQSYTTNMSTEYKDIFKKITGRQKELRNLNHDRENVKRFAKKKRDGGVVW